MDSYPDLTNEQKDVFRVIVKTGRPISIAEIVGNLRLSDYKVRKAVGVLYDEKHLLERTGNSVSTRYAVVGDSVEAITQLQIELAAIKDMKSF